MFAEMRLAAGLQAIVKGPRALTALDVLTMATREGARALGLDSEIGSIEPGKHADLFIIDRDRPHLATGPDPVSTVVYSARPSDVRTTIVGGEVVVDDYRLTRTDASDIARTARAEAVALAARAF
jgi:5-methylthioadenosine/S-adenosylhomocysteine deaminase